MATLVKFATVDVEKFDHLDLGITRHWRGIDLETMSDEQIVALRTYSKSPRIVQVHPEDGPTFAEFVGEPMPEPDSAPSEGEDDAKTRKRQARAK